MGEIVRYTLDTGEEVLVEVDDDAYLAGDDQIERAADDEDDKTQRKIEEVLKTTLPAARRVSEGVRALAPDSYEVQFGIKLSGEVGFLAKASAEAQFTVKLTWGK